MGKAFEGLGRALSLLRTERRLSQSRLAELSGVNKSLISRYERGQVEPTFESVNRLLDALGATRQDFHDYLGRVQRSAGGAMGGAGVLGAGSAEAYLVIPLRGLGDAAGSEVLRSQVSRVLRLADLFASDPQDLERRLGRRPKEEEKDKDKEKNAKKAGQEEESAGETGEDGDEGSEG